jgi:hypothetical protein
MALRPRKPFKKPAPKKQDEADEPPAQCAKCQADLEPRAMFCGECGAAVKASAKPRRSMAEVRRSLDKGKNKRLIQTGRETMMWLGLLHVGAGLVVYLINKGEMDKLLALPLDDPMFRSMLLEKFSEKELTQSIWLAKHWGAICFVTFGLPGFILLGLWQWAKSNPLPATVAGLVTYLTFMVAGFALNPASMLSPVGWIFRAAIIGAFASAIRSASTERRIQERERARKRREAAEQAEESDDEMEEEESGETA